MQQFIQEIQAGGTWQLQTGGDYFRLVACPSPVDVKFFRAGQEVASAVQMDTGFYLKPVNGFDRVDITSATLQTVKIMVLDGDGGYDHFNVDITSALQDIAVNISGSASMTVANVPDVHVTNVPDVHITNVPQMTVQQAATITDKVPVSIGVAATAIVAADATRKGLRLTNAGSFDIYIGGAGVTTANGAIKIQPGQTWIEDQASVAAWYGISGTAGQSLRIQEIK